MSRHFLVPLAALSVAACVVAPSAVSFQNAQPGPEAARLEHFSDAQGTSYFALSLKPQVGLPPAGSRDLVVLFDTSASQTGKFRDHALKTLRDTLSALSPQDRVHLMAVDLHAIPMTDTFVAPGSSQMAEALDKLQRRVPLGATDMETALNAAADSLAGDGRNPRAIVYIGEGSSRANLLDAKESEALVGKLLDARISVNGCAVGPRPDRQLLGVLAGRTGGVLISADVKDAAGDDVKDAGRALAEAARAEVLWPTASVELPAGFTAYPLRTPPLRSDRDTVMIGTFSGQGPFEIKLDVAGSGGPQELSWTVSPGQSRPENSYLARLVECAKVDGGAMLPLIGSESLVDARVAVDIGAYNLVELAGQALATGRLEDAQRLADEALKNNPADKKAQAVKDEAARRQQGGGEPVAKGGPLGAPVPEPAGVDLGGDGDLNLIGGDGNAAAAFGAGRRAIEQVIRTEVSNTINDARALMGVDPEVAKQNLKLQLEQVRQATDLDPEVRAQLENQLQAALREAKRRQTEFEYQRQKRHELLAAAKERMLIYEDLMRDQEKVKQLMERFDSLMEEGRYEYAEEGAASEVRDMEAGAVGPTIGRIGRAATLYARTTGYWEDAMALRVARQKGAVDMLAGVEKSHIPFPDEPPIVYPPAEVWQELSARRKEKYSSMTLASQGDREKQIMEALDSPTKLEFHESPLEDVIEYLKQYHDIEIQLDTRALGDVGLGTDTPISKSLKGISLRSALRLMLSEFELTYIIDNEVLLITTKEQAESEEHMSTKVYPVADLVLPINNSMMMGYGGMGGMGMGGGMGMRGGGMGGGMGGMGMGGMGGMRGGMGGGMGGMGMGMGFMNVPRNILPNVPPGGFRAFSVTDDVPPAAKTQEATSPADEPKQIPLDFSSGVDPQTHWDKYFASHRPTEEAVRRAVRRLKAQKKLDHVIAMINAALRNCQPQPWMYDAMTLAMLAEGYSRREVERVVMSAVDFIDSTADLMYVGTYLTRLGMHERALQVFRQVSTVEPLWPEPYMLGLSTAQRLDDQDGIRWASLGILRQAWTAEQARVGQKGYFAALDLLETLKAQKQIEKAKQFQAELDQAVRRDCVVMVSWIGDADLDLLVEEPSGTVCSLRNRRTSAGGVMLGDALAGLGREGSEEYREIYVCPEGFSGTYRMMVRRVWGKVPTGKVKVAVYTDFRGQDQKCVARRVELKDDSAVVTFDLGNGRRQEAIKDHQVANAAIGQLALRKAPQVLAQQLAAAFDPRAASSLATSRAAAAGGGFPFFRTGGAVGYQPIIITLPEGTNMMATAVISADRRYVRITPAPLFSGIAEVNTFNTASGQGSGGVGTGGRGFSGIGGGLGGTGGGFGGGGGGFGGGGFGGGGFGGGGFGGGGRGGIGGGFGAPGGFF